MWEIEPVTYDNRLYITYNFKLRLIEHLNKRTDSVILHGLAASDLRTLMVSKRQRVVSLLQNILRTLNSLTKMYVGKLVFESS